MGTVTILILGFIFIAVPASHAQSSQTWSEPINLSNSGFTTNPLMVVDSHGTIHVIWLDTIEEKYKYVQSEDGVNWASPLTVNFPFPTEYSSREFPFTIEEFPPILVPNDSGLIHIFWRNERGSLFYNNALAENLGKPSAWSGFTQLTDTALDFDVGLDSDGNVHIGFLRTTTSDIGPPGIYYRKLDIGRLNWSSNYLLYESQYFRGLYPEEAHVRLATSSEMGTENVYVVWDDRPNKRIYVATSMDGGLTWHKTEQLKGPSDFIGYQSIHPLENEYGKELEAQKWLRDRLKEYSFNKVDFFKRTIG